MLRRLGAGTLGGVARGVPCGSESWTPSDSSSTHFNGQWKFMGHLVKPSQHRLKSLFSSAWRPEAGSIPGGRGGERSSGAGG